MKYIKQLDSVRAIAVIFVIISHWAPDRTFTDRISIGPIGVDIFFVLSGFLISKILFDNREKSDLLNIPKSTLVKNFYVRRTLRIFPIYYLTIFVLLLFGESTGTNIRYAFKYLFTYTSNFYFFRMGGWDGMLSHLWSLAVEEQFYLIWPWIILFANKRYFLPIISGFIFIGVLSQYLTRGVNLGDILTFTCFDAFGLGAILAWMITYAEEKLKKFYWVVSIVAAVSFLLYVQGAIQQEWNFIPIRTLISFIALWLITYIFLNRETNSLKAKFILNNSVLIFLGKISYGLYLYHNIIPGLLNSNLINKYLNPLLPDLLYKKHWNLLFILENSILLLVISWLSFLFIEKRFLNLKKYFEYRSENGIQPKYWQQKG